MATELARAVVKIGADIGDLQAGLALARGEMEKTGRELGQLGRSLSLRITLPLAAAAALAVKEFGQEADAIAKVNAVLKATGNISGQTTEGIKTMAAALQATTRFSDDAVISAAGLLGTFQQIRNEVGAGNDIFDRTIRTATDLSSVMGTDLNQAILSLGRALESPSDGLMLLRRAGIQFSESEKFQIKTLVEHGQVLEAQRLILAKVEGKTRDAAKALADTPLGRFTQAWNAVKDALEDVGEILVRVLVPLADSVKALANAFKALPPEVQTGIVVVAGIAAAIGPLLIAIAALSKALVFLRTLFGLGTLAAGATAALGAVKVALLALVSPLGLVAVGIGALTFGWLKAKMAAEEARRSAQAATDQMISGFSSLSPKQVEARVARFTTVITKYQAEVDELKASLIAVATAQAGVADATATRMSRPVIPPAVQPGTVMEHIAALQELIARLNVARGALVELSKGFEETGSRVNEELTTALLEADAKLKQALVSANALGKVMGPSFNEAAARAQALEAHMKAVADAGAKAGETAGQIAARLRQAGNELRAAQLAAAINDATRALKVAQTEATVLAQVLGPSFDMGSIAAAALRTKIDETIKAMITAEKSVEEIIDAVRQLGIEWQTATLEASLVELNKELVRAHREAQVLGQVLGPSFVMARAEADALRANIVAVVAEMVKAGATTDEIIARVSDLGRELHQLEERARVGEFFVDQLGLASDAVLDFVTGAKTSIGDFIRQALLDFSKLIARIELMKLIMGIGGKAASAIGGGATFGVDGASVGDIPTAAHGGTFPLRQWVVVGEEGPELVMADRGGMTVDPLVNFPQFTSSNFINPVELSVVGNSGPQLMMATHGKLRIRDLPQFAKGGFLPRGEVGVVGEKGPELIAGGSAGLTIEPIKVNVDVPQFASGGFLSPGELGLVGETGPELVRAGRSGATIATVSDRDLPAQGGDRITVPVTLNVAAVDSRDVARFFEENEALVANTMLRAFQRSRLLGRQLGVF